MGTGEFIAGAHCRFGKRGYLGLLVAAAAPVIRVRPATPSCQGARGGILSLLQYVAAVDRLLEWERVIDARVGYAGGDVAHADGRGKRQADGELNHVPLFSS